MQQTQVPDCNRRLHVLDVGTLVLTGTYIVTAEIAMLHRLPLFWFYFPSESKNTFGKENGIICKEIFTCCILFFLITCFPHTF